MMFFLALFDSSFSITIDNFAGKNWRQRGLLRSFLESSKRWSQRSNDTLTTAPATERRRLIDYSSPN